jgi:hypothetical protein
MATLVGEFTGPSQEKLNQIIEAAPVKFLAFPKVYFSIPKKEIVSALLQETATVMFQGNETLYNTKTKIAEFDIFLSIVNQNRFALGQFDRKVNSTFRPYFCWLIEPNRSRTVVRYAIAAVNALANHQEPLEVKLTLVDDHGETAQHFNPSTLDEDIPRIP